MKKNCIILVVLLSLALSSTGAFADANPNPAPPAAPFTLNAESIRHQLLENNLSLIETMQRVHDAKDTVNIARANLFPSINLGIVLHQTGASFLISSIQFLLPFLMPSNWFNLSAAKEQFQAEKVSYKILELNAYSSALSLYFTMQSDLQLGRVYQQEYEDLNKIYQILKKESDLLGLASPEDVKNAQTQALLALARVKGISAVLNKESAAMGHALGLAPLTPVALEEALMPVSDWEGKQIQDAITQANIVAPEHEQIDYVVKAAENQEWSAVFGFINAWSVVGQITGTQQNTLFNNLTTKGGINLGFAIFPSVELAKRNVEEIKLRKVEVEQENAEVLQSTLGSMSDIKLQYDLDSQAENSANDVYQAELKKYNLGVGSITDVLLARTKVTLSSTSRINDQMNLNILRALLHRTMITDQYSQIKGCGAEQSGKKDDSCSGIFGWLGCLFGGGEKDQPTLDQVCKEGGVRPAPSKQASEIQ